MLRLLLFVGAAGHAWGTPSESGHGARQKSCIPTSCCNSWRSQDRYKNSGLFQMRHSCLLLCPCQIPVQELYWSNFITCNFRRLSWAFVDRTFSECAPDLGLLAQFKDWRSGEATSFCPRGPSCTSLSKIRQVGNRRSASSGHAPVRMLPQLLGWER